MITVYTFGPNLGVPEPSPFVLKVMTYLKMAGIDFKEEANFGNLQKAPKAKLPFIDDSGEIIADSVHIIKHLKAKYGDMLDAHLNQEQTALSQLMGKSLDENFYWCIVYSRWIRESSWPITKQRFFGDMPFPLKMIVPIVARKGVKDSIMKHGIGKHSDAELLAIADDTLNSLSVLLGDKTYIWGEQLCSLDASIFAFVTQLALSDLDNDFTRLTDKYPNLVEYCQRIHKTYFAG